MNIVETGKLGCAVRPASGRIRRGKVRAVFARSEHVALDDGTFLTLGGTTLPAHPASILWPTFAPAPAVGREAAVTPEGLFLEGRLRASFAAMDVFIPSRECLSPAPPGRMRAAVGASLERAARMESRGGFHEIFLRRLGVPSAACPDAFSGFLAERGEVVAASLTREIRRGDWEAMARRARECAGEGIGLTPAGDDFLAGVLAALRYHGHSGGRPAPSQRLLDGLARAAGSRTTPFSAFLLAGAARGLVGAPFSGWLSAVHRGDAESAARLVGEMAAVGHSSGLDTLAGMLLAMQAILGGASWTDNRS